jgi:superfamily II DNA or RNA helicase
MYISMAISFPVDYLDEAIMAIIEEHCIIKPKANQYNEDPEAVHCFNIDDETNRVYVPMGMWKLFYDKFPTRHDYSINNNLLCSKELYTLETDPKKYRDQDVVFDKALHKLQKDSVVFLNLNTGFGKTTIGNYIGCYLKHKIAIINYLDKVNSQWIEEFEKFSNATIQKVKTNKPLDPYADVYIFGVYKPLKFSREDLKDIGTVIVDEAHMATSTVFSQTLLRFQPKNLIILTATPNLTPFKKLFKPYGGDKKNYIVRKEKKNFTVYKYYTEYIPTFKYNFYNNKTTLDWTTVINSISCINDRHKEAVKLCLDHPDEKIMILSLRNNECQSIYEKLLEADQYVDIFIGNKKTQDKDARILVAGMKKAGVGFDDPALTMLISMSDVKEVIQQYEGRLRTVDCTIYDFVDNDMDKYGNSTLETHWEIREKWYTDRGATIKIIHSATSEERMKRRQAKKSKPNKFRTLSKSYL